MFTATEGDGLMNEYAAVDDASRASTLASMNGVVLGGSGPARLGTEALLNEDVLNSMVAAFDLAAPVGGVGKSPPAPQIVNRSLSGPSNVCVEPPSLPARSVSTDHRDFPKRKVNGKRVAESELKAACRRGDHTTVTKLVRLLPRLTAFGCRCSERCHRAVHSCSI